MSKIEDLIAQFCPEGVEWKSIGEIAQLSNTGVDKKILKNETNVKLLNFVDVFHNQYLTNDSPKMIVTANNRKITECNILKGDIFITPSSELIDEIGQSAMAIEHIVGAVYSYHIMRIRLHDKKNINPAFINYLFYSNELKKQIRFKAQGITRFGLTKPNWESLSIPVPPLPVQEEIVNILDKFTALEAELEAELEVRTRQYEYYRNQLLAFESEDVEWKTLGEVCENINAGGDLPKRLNKDQDKPSDEYPYPIYANAVEKNGLYGFTDSYKIESDSVTIAARGAKIGFHVVREGKYTPIVRLISLIPNKDIITTRFLNYVLDITEIAGTKGGIPQLTVPTVKKIEIPIPSIEEQERIVAILDKFDALVNDISVGLPAEIQARKQQYEYYRGKLLMFEPLAIAEVQ